MDAQALKKRQLAAIITNPAVGKTELCFDFLLPSWHKNLDDALTAGKGPFLQGLLRFSFNKRITYLWPICHIR